MAVPDDQSAGSSRFEVLRAQAESVREQSRATVRRAHATWEKVSAEWQQVEARWRGTEQLRERWLSHAAKHEERQFCAYARMQERLTSTRVIEQAKGILMAEYGFTADQASDELRRASLRCQMRVPDLAAAIVIRTAEMDQPKPERGLPGERRQIRDSPATT